VTDRITLTGLRVRGWHGVLAAERVLGQEFVVDAVLELDTAAAVASDDIRDTVNYGELAAALAAIVAGEPLNLIETLAYRLATECLRNPLVTATEITVHKPHAPVAQQFTDISVTLRRIRP
jgi:7,8-dihydroneopterin aldolase/epimerase/oxygenase